MERNPQDQNLADAPDDENKIFNPANVLSEPANKKPVGPMGAPQSDPDQESKPTDTNPIGQANQPVKNDDNTRKPSEGASEEGNGKQSDPDS